MKVMQLAAPGGFEHLKLVDCLHLRRPPPARSRYAFTPARSTTTTWAWCAAPARRPTAAFPWPTAQAWSRPWAQA
jgi:hypothetical protein